MAKWAMSSEYLRNRTDETLRLQLRAKLAEIRTGVENDDFFDHPPGTSWRIKHGSACAERIHDEMQMRGIHI